MTNYREILRLANLGLNRTSIGATLGYSRNTVADVLKRAGEKNVAWPLPDGMCSRELLRRSPGVRPPHNSETIVKIYSIDERRK